VRVRRGFSPHWLSGANIRTDFLYNSPPGTRVPPSALLFAGRWAGSQENVLVAECMPLRPNGNLWGFGRVAVFCHMRPGGNGDSLESASTKEVRAGPVLWFLFLLFTWMTRPCTPKTGAIVGIPGPAFRGVAPLAARSVDLAQQIPAGPGRHTIRLLDHNPTAPLVALTWFWAFPKCEQVADRFNAGSRRIW